MELLDILFNFLPPILIALTGYLLSISLFRGFEKRHLIEKYMISITLGFFVFVLFPVVWNLVINQSLTTFFVVFTIVIVAFDSLLAFRHFVLLKNDVIAVLHKTKELMNGNFLQKTVIIFFVLFVIKILFSLSIRPLNDSDAVRQYLPLALDFNTQGGIGTNLSESIGSILINSWSFGVFGFSVEPFRLIPSVLLISFPLLVFLITRSFLNQNYAYVAMVISCFSPFFDNAINLAYYPDIFAVPFVVFSVYFVLKTPKLTNAILAGLSLTLAFFLKSSYAYVGAITVIACLGLTGKIKSYLLSSLLLIALFAYSWPSLQKMNIYNTFDLVILSILGIIVVIYSTPHFKKIKNEENSQDKLRKILYGLLPVIITILLCLPWKFRQMYISGEFVEALTSSANDYWRQFWAFTGQISVKYDFFMIFHNPALNIYLSIVQLVGLISCFFSDDKRKIGFIFLLNYFIFFTPFATSPTYRHLLFGYFFLIPIAAVGLLDILTKYVKNLTPKIITIYILIFAFLSTLQHQSFNLFFEHISYQNNLSSIIDYIRVSNFFAKTYAQIENFMLIIIIAVIVTFLFPLLLRLGTFLPKRKLKRHLVNGCLFVFVFSLVFIPVFQGAFLTSGGDLLNYEYAGSSYKHEIYIAQEINAFTDENDVILTFYFTAVYYLEAEAIELTSTKLMPAIEANNVTDILQTFDTLNITYVMLPTSQFWYKRYSDFIGFTQKSSMFKILYDSGCMMPVIDGQGKAYGVYAISYNNSSYLKATGYCNGILYSNETNDAHSYNTISDTHYVIKSGDQFQYCLMIPCDNPEYKAGVEIYFSNGLTLSELQCIDQNGLLANPATDLSKEVNPDCILTDVGLWYLRSIDFPAELIGKEIAHMDIVFEGDLQGLYTTYYGDIKIVDKHGTVVYVGFSGESPTDVVNHDKQGYFGVTLETVNPPLVKRDMTLSVVNAIDIANFDSLDSWYARTYLSNVAITSIDTINFVEGNASVQVRATDLLPDSAVTLELQYVTPQNWEELNLLYLDFRVDFASMNITVTQRILIRDDAGHLQEFWFLLASGQWKPIICELSNPSDACGELNLQKVSKIQIQIRNWNKLEIPYLTFWVDNLSLCESVTLEPLLPRS